MVEQSYTVELTIIVAFVPVLDVTLYSSPLPRVKLNPEATPVIHRVCV